MKKNEFINEEIKVVEVSFLLLKDAAVEFCPGVDVDMEDDFSQSKKQTLDELRHKANALRLNFVSAEEFNLVADASFANATGKESVVLRSGSTVGSVRATVKVETKINNPSLEKLDKIIEKLDEFSVLSITYGCAIPLKENETLEEVGKRCFQKLQSDYTILSFDNDKGVKIEVDKDLFYSLIIKEGLLMVSIETRYSFQLPKKLTAFPVFDFIRTLIS